MARKPNHRATFRNVIKINKRLEEVLELLGGGICAYKDSFSDQSIAGELGVSPVSVAQIRRDEYGQLRPTPAPDVPSEGFIKLLADHASLQANHRDLTERFNKLCLLLSVNKVVDARHLQMPSAAPLFTPPVPAK